MEGDVLALGCGLTGVYGTFLLPGGHQLSPLLSMEKGVVPALEGQPGTDGEKAEGGEEEDIAGLGYGSRPKGTQGRTGEGRRLGGESKVLKCSGRRECRSGPGCSTEPGSASRQHGWMESLGRTNQPAIPEFRN